MTGSFDNGARPFLIGLDLVGQKVVVVGGDRAAEEKVKILADTEANIVVVALDLTSGLAALAESGHIRWERRRFRRTDPSACRLVILANDEGLGVAHVRKWCGRFRTLLNVVDKPEACDVIMPSTLRCGPATVAVSTGGVTPAGARFLREEIERVLPDRMAELLETAGQARVTLRDLGAYRYDYATWRAFFNAGLASDSEASLGEFRDEFVSNF